MPYLDCFAAAKYFLSPEVLAKYMIDPERVAVSGDSAGGNLAAAVAQQVRARAMNEQSHNTTIDYQTLFNFAQMHENDSATTNIIKC